MITQQAAFQGLGARPMDGDALYSPDLIKLGGAAVEGVLSTAGFYPDTDDELAREFVRNTRTLMGSARVRDQPPIQITANPLAARRNTRHPTAPTTRARKPSRPAPIPRHRGAGWRQRRARPCRDVPGGRSGRARTDRPHHRL